MMMKDKMISRVVDADNIFKFAGYEFVIPEENESYKVASKYGEVEDYENYSNTDTVKILIDDKLTLRFYDEDGKEIEGILIIKK